MARSKPQKKRIENNIGAVRRFRGIKQAEAAAASRKATKARPCEGGDQCP